MTDDRQERAIAESAERYARGDCTLDEHAERVENILRGDYDDHLYHHLEGQTLYV